MWKALPACGVERLALRTDDGMFMVSTRDNMIAFKLFSQGRFDKPLVDKSCSMASNYLDRTELIYLDVGANIGTNTIYALRNPAFTGAVCFEPDEVNFSNLVQTVHMSGVANQVRYVRTALGNREGKASLALSTVNFGDHHILPGNGLEVGLVSVAVMTLDASLTEEELERVGLVCVDVQGYEAQVLGGATTLLGRDVPFLCELTPNQLRQCDGYERFFEIAEQSFNFFIDMREPDRQRRIGELRECAESLNAGGYTDVFMTKRAW